MLLIYNRETSPAYNLAAEEYVLTEKCEDIVMLWRNSDSVIIGRNQNAIEEMNLDYIKENDITVIRRLTGGGAVFHDLGNVNFTFIKGNDERLFNDYSGFTAPVREYLESLGVKCELSGRNDITIEGAKISGNAQTVKRGRIMHHGTLLFSSNMGKLSGALKVREIKAESRGIKSYRSRVTNISEHLSEKMGVEDFLEGLYEWFYKNVPDAEKYEFSEEDRREIERLVEEKYGLWEWNFGNSPKYNYRNMKKYPFGVVEIYIETENATVTGINIKGDFFGVRDICELENGLVGTAHSYEKILEKARELCVGSYISGMTEVEFAKLVTEQ